MQHCLVRIATAAERRAQLPRGLAARLSSSFSHVSQNDPLIIEKEKERALAAASGSASAQLHQMPGADGWSEALASDSEAAVKADRVELDIHELEQFTEERLRSEDGEATKPHEDIRSGALRENMERTRGVAGSCPN